MTTPKTRLLRDVIRATEIAKHLNGDVMEDAIETAWSEYCLGLPVTTPVESHFKREGAKEFIDVLLNIAKENVAPKKSQFPTLNP